MNVRLSQMDNVIWGTLIVGGGAVNQTKHLNINIVKINSRTDLTYETHTRRTSSICPKLWKGRKQMELVCLGLTILSKHFESENSKNLQIFIKINK